MHFKSFESRPYKQRIRIIAITLFVGLVWLWITRTDSIYENPNILSAPQSGFRAPDFTLLDNSGNEFTLSEFQGKPVIINLWASWCNPCKAEMPALQTVYEAYRDRNLIILAVNATNQDSREAAINFANDLGLKFHILFDVDGTVSRLYRLQALPSTFFVDSKGIIQEVVVGGPMAEALLRTRVENMIKIGDTE